MNIQSYLERIQYKGEIHPTLDVLCELQRQHLLCAPFENLDIHYGNPITLDIEKTYEKIVGNKRGGFCYELNGLFFALLRELGFKAKRVSARVWNRKTQKYGQEFDHLAIIVEIDGKEYLVDVGFGEFAFAPIHIELNKIQEDARGDFIIEEHEDGYFRVSKMSGGAKIPEYIFTKKAREMEEFVGMCHYHQTSPRSSFTQKRLISKPTEKGRVTISGDMLKITQNDEAILEEEIEDVFLQSLKKYFDIGDQILF